jgi:hypothetical protein
MKKILASLVFLSAAQATFGLTDTNKADMLTLTIINNSSQTLTYTGVSGVNTGNTFLIDNKKITPGDKAIVTGKTTPYADLAGAMSFNDEDGRSNILTVIDQRKYKVGQGIFLMRNDQFISFDTKTLNTSSNPHALNYNFVTLIIRDNAQNFPTEIRVKS